MAKGSANLQEVSPRVKWKDCSIQNLPPQVAIERSQPKLDSVWVQQKKC